MLSVSRLLYIYLCVCSHHRKQHEVPWTSGDGAARQPGDPTVHSASRPLSTAVSALRPSPAHHSSQGTATTERLPRTTGQDAGGLCAGDAAQPWTEVACPVREHAWTEVCT